MAFWDVDLTTRAGAREAMHQGSLACFVFCGMAALGVGVSYMGGISQADAFYVAIAAGCELVIGLIAGLRLRAGKGFYWTIGAATLLGIELLFKVVSLAFGGLFIGVPALVFMINAVRAASALKNEVGFEDDDVEVFT